MNKSSKQPFFLIAEAGINHNGHINKAIKLVDKAKISGASAIKFQTYKTEQRVKKNNPAFKVLKKCELSFNDFEKIKNYCSKKKIMFFSTPFDNESVDFLAKLKVKLFKISSFDTSNFQLVDHIISKKIPTIISTGLSSLKEIEKITKKFKKNKVNSYLLHCISSYPTNEESSILSNIQFLKKKFNCEVGLSDHTNDIKTSIYSYLIGARIIEKHFKLSNKDRCVDAAVSITPSQMKSLSNELNRIPKIFGKPKFGVRNVEKTALIFKRKKIYE